MNLSLVMDEIADQIRTIDGLQVIAFPARSVIPPAAIIDFPDSYTFDATHGRGADVLTIPVFVIAGKVWDERTRDTLSGFVDGSGDDSIKAVIEGGTYSAFDTADVTEVEFTEIVLAGNSYFGAKFTVQIAGPGGSS